MLSNPQACNGSLCLKQMGVLTALNWRRFEKWDGSISIPLFTVYSYRLVRRLITAFILQIKYLNSRTHVFGKRAWLITSLKLNFWDVSRSHVTSDGHMRKSLLSRPLCSAFPQFVFSLTCEDFGFPLRLADKDASQPIRQFAVKLWSYIKIILKREEKPKSSSIHNYMIKENK